MNNELTIHVLLQINKVLIALGVAYILNTYTDVGHIFRLIIILAAVVLSDKLTKLYFGLDKQNEL